MKKLQVVSSITATLMFSMTAAVAQNASDKWVSYSARYSETMSSHDTSGNKKHTQSVFQVTRANDGSELSVHEVNGQLTKGKLWQACGQIISLDYIAKRAAVTGQAPRKHLQLPSAPPTGSTIIAGVSCLIYPLHVSNGQGTLCVDAQDDILVREDFHTDLNGLHQDYIKELTSIDFEAPVDSSKMAIPNGFTTLAPSTGSPKSCGVQKQSH
jgi:hypothetical protein